MKLLFSLFGVLVLLSSCSRHQEESDKDFPLPPGSGMFISAQYSGNELQYFPNLEYSRRLNEQKKQYSSDYNKATDAGKDTLSLQLDIVTPPNPGNLNLPLVVTVHAGAYSEGNKEDMQETLKQYAKYGFMAASINYRLSPDALLNEQTILKAISNASEDLMNAIRYLKMHAGDYHIDTSRIAVLGLSAGGVITLINAAENNHFNQSLNDFKGISSQVAASVTTGAAFNKLLKPLLKFEGNPSSVLMFHARENDNITGMTWSGNAVPTSTALSRSGKTCVLVALPNLTHLIDMNPGGAWWYCIQPFLWKSLRLYEY